MDPSGLEWTRSGLVSPIGVTDKWTQVDSSGLEVDPLSIEFHNNNPSKVDPTHRLAFIIIKGKWVHMESTSRPTSLYWVPVSPNGHAAVEGGNEIYFFSTFWPNIQKVHYCSHCSNAQKQISTEFLACQTLTGWKFTWDLVVGVDGWNERHIFSKPFSLVASQQIWSTTYSSL